MARHSRDDCQAGPDNEFGFVRFFERGPSVKFQPNPLEQKPMFAFDRSALAVLLPLALLVAVVLFSNRMPDQTAQTQSESGRADQAVAANLPSR
jgi:hypothetical protein